MEITLYVKPHIKRFIPRYLNTPEPVFISLDSIHGKIFAASCFVNKDGSRIYEKDDAYSEVLVIDINKDLSRMHLNKAGIQKANIYLEKLFIETMCQWALASVHSGGFASDGIRNFLKYYRVSEDHYSWNSAHRAWMRYYRRENENSCPVLS